MSRTPQPTICLLCDPPADVENLTLHLVLEHYDELPDEVAALFRTIYESEIDA